MIAKSKSIPFIFVALLACAQSTLTRKSKPQTLEPIRVEVMAAADGGDGRELSRLVRMELQKTGNVIAATNKADFVVRMVVAKDEECGRYVAGTVIVTKSSGRFGHSIDTGRDLAGIAARIAAKMNTDYFNPRGEK